MKLHNTEDWRLLKENMLRSDQERVTISFYQYAHIRNPQIFRDHMYCEWQKLNVYGRIYVATEGINAQLSVPRENLYAFREQLYSISFLNGIRLNYAVDDDGKSFYKLQIKVRNKILADGLNDDTFDVTDKGVHLNAKEFNELTSKEDTILIDMRNHYEHEVGHFVNAITPDVDTFRDSLPYIAQNLKGKEEKNIVMYCTGGIRCEKASAWFKHQGFKNVHQLEGGIIEYARQVKEQGLDNRFRGKNFVFDERLAETISEEVIAQCHQCGQPCDTHTNCENAGCHLLFIQCDECRSKFENCCSEACLEVIHLPEEEQKKLRAGKDNGNKAFKKGRSPHLNRAGSGLQFEDVKTEN